MRKIASVGKRLWLLSLSLLMFGFVSGQITVTGVITDISDAGGGEPVIGANVVVKGTTTGTATDFDGKYSITVPDGNAVLVYSFIGLESQEIKVGARTKIDVALNVNSRKVEEVVKMGYMVQKKADATSASSNVATGDLADKPTLSVDKALQGKAAGVRVTSNSGSPGSGVQVQIRGNTSLSGGSSPLYVVDGVPRGYDVKDLNPGDIESIDILKDASATALYGARGAAGVVVITTKGGSKFAKKSCEENFTVTIDGFYGMQQAWRLPEMASGSEWIDIVNRESIASGKDSLILDAYKDSVVSTDWLGEIFRKATMKKYQFSVEGNSQKSSYSVSGSYFGQNGIVKGSDYERFTGRVKSSHKIHDRVTIGDDIGFNRTRENIINEGDVWTGVVPNAVVFDPTVPVYNESGNWSQGSIYRGYKPTDTTFYQYNKDFKNPVGLVELNNDERTGYGFGGNLWANVDIMKNLSFRSTVNMGMWGNDRVQYIPVHSISASQSVPKSSLTREVQSGVNATNNNILNYSFDIRNADSSEVLHGFNFMIGNEYLYEFSETNRSIVYNVPESEDMRYLVSGTDGKVEINSWQAPNEHTMASYMGRAEYSLMRKYLVNATIRRDGSSRFGADNRWGTFPAFGFGWKINEENFMKNNESLKLISELKLRGGWGRIGNENIGNYKYTANIVRDPRSRYNFDDVVVTTANLQAQPNIGIRWEETETVNLGLDVALWKHKLTGSVDVYRKSTIDMLIREPQPAVVGVDGASNNPEANAGEMRNVGSEFSLNYRDNDRAFKYSFGGNISFNKNEVTKLGDERFSDRYISGGPVDQPKWYVSRTAVGRSVADFYGYKTDGLYQNWTEVNAGSDPNAKPGSVRFVDMNGDGQINADDMTYIGSPHAKFTYGFDFSANYKGFDFGMNWSGVYGNQIFNAVKYFSHGGEFYSNRSKDRVTVWTAENPVDETNNAKDYLSRQSDLYIEDGSYLRLKSIVLGYTLPIDLLSKVNIEKMRFYVSAENLLTLTKYSGFDPEIGSNELVGWEGPELGIDRGVYPQAKIYSVGFSLTF